MTERPITEDTKRALEIIGPMAKELNIWTDADEHYLYLDGQAIGIVCNSTYATVMEFIGYVFLRVWAKEKSQTIRGEVLERIKCYWYSDEQVEQFRKMREQKGYQ